MARSSRCAPRASLPAHATLNYAGLTLSGAELQAAFEAALGRPLQRAVFPWWLLRLAAPVWPMGRALLEMRYLWQRPHRLDDARLRALSGEVPSTPLADIVRQCLSDLIPGPPGRSGARV
jgi:hypothetical protein